MSLNFFNNNNLFFYKKIFNKNTILNICNLLDFLNISFLNSFRPFFICSYNYLKSYINIFNFILKIKLKSNLKNSKNFLIIFDYRDNYKSILRKFLIKKSIVIFFNKGLNNISNYDFKVNISTHYKDKNLKKIINIFIIKDIINIYL